MLTEYSEEGIVEICEQINKGVLTSEISSLLLKSQANPKSFGIVKNAEEESFCVQVKLKEEKESSALINADIFSKKEKMEQTLMGANGCGEKQTQIGNMEKDMSVELGTKKEKFPNGEERYMQGIITHAKIAEYLQNKKDNLMHTTLKVGQNIQKEDLKYQTGEPYARNATKKYTKKIDLLTAGVPCQPASVAGKRRGTKDDRWLWKQTFEVIRHIKPRFCILENVRGILSLEGGMVFENLLLELESYGYETATFVIPACAVNAPHKRERVWIIANSNLRRCKKQWEQIEVESNIFEFEREIWRSVKPTVCRINHGIPNRVDRLRSLGNAIVPQVAVAIMQSIKECEP